METGITTIKSNSAEILQDIKNLLDYGSYVLFTTKSSGIQKVVTEWNMDEMGDLTAEYSTGRTLYVRPDSTDYNFEGITFEEFEELKSQNKVTI